MNIIYISFVRLTDVYIKEMMIDYFIERNVSVQYWDIVSLVRANYIDKNQISPKYLTTILSWSELKKHISLNKSPGTYYIVQMPYGGQFLRIFRLLNKYRLKTAFIYFARIPLPNTNVSFFKKIRNLTAEKSRMVKMIYWKALDIYYKKLKLTSGWDIVFYAGTPPRNKKLPAANRIVNINSADYEAYRIANSNRRYLGERNYALFLDGFLPFHPDFKLMGVKQIDSARYFKELNSFFQKIESFFNLEVVISLHPKSQYESDFFDGRLQIKGKTPELVKDSKIVISHCSVSLSYAVLNYIPMLHIYNNDISDLYPSTHFRYIAEQAKFLNSPLINISDEIKLNDTMLEPVNHALYNKYKYEFLTSIESENKYTPEIIYSTLIYQS